MKCEREMRSYGLREMLMLAGCIRFMKHLFSINAFIRSHAREALVSTLHMMKNGWEKKERQRQREWVHYERITTKTADRTEAGRKRSALLTVLIQWFITSWCVAVQFDLFYHWFLHFYSFIVLVLCCRLHFGFLFSLSPSPFLSLSLSLMRLTQKLKWSMRKSLISHLNFSAQALSNSRKKNIKEKQFRCVAILKSDDVRCLWLELCCGLLLTVMIIGLFASCTMLSSSFFRLIFKLSVLICFD